MYRPLLIPLFSLCAAFPFVANAEPLKPAWDALPPETALALRLPNGTAYANSIKDTKIGQHLFGEERLAEFQQMLERESGEGWTNFQQKLTEAGLEPNDFLQLLRGETGAAVVIEKAAPGEGPKLFVLFWAEPGEEHADKLMQAFLNTLDEQETEHPVRRVDFSLVERDVVHLSVPQTGWTMEGERTVTHNVDVLLTREAGRISGVTTLMSGPSLVEGSDAIPAPKAEPSEEILGIFARFLQQQRLGTGGFSSDLLAAPGVHSALPSGVSGMEMAMDVPRIIAAALAEEEDPSVRRTLDALGFLGLGKMAVRGTMDGTVARWGGIISAPEPRRGVVSALTSQRALSPRPASWVPAHVLDYSHFSINLGELFVRIREIMIDVGGEQAEQMLAMAEMQVQGMLEINIQSLLSSLGQQHTILTFPSTPGSLDDSSEADVGRVALVWTLEDQEVWQRIMQTIGMFAPMMGDALKAAQEQGFSGWRLENEMFEGGLFLGQDRLVFGMGKGTLEEVFSALRNPPEGENSLAQSSKYAEAQGLLNLRPSIYSDVQDLGRQVAEAARMIGTLMTDDDNDLVSEETASRLVGILDPEVLREAFGMGANQIFVTRDGIVFEGASELAPAER